MRYSKAVYSTFALLLLASFTFAQQLTVTSKKFKEGEKIPRKYSCEGREVNPPLQIGNIPAGTQTLAITVHDPDAPISGGYTHWVAWNLAADGNIKEHTSDGDRGVNTAGNHNYLGMCPPSGSHHYHFKVYALDSKLNIDLNTDKNGLEQKMEGHVLAMGELVEIYEKK